MMGVYSKLLEIQQALKAPKGQTNTFGKYNYRSCEDIVEAVKPLLGEQKAVLTISDEIKLVGERYYIFATATIIDAETGETVAVTAQAREANEKRGMDTSQVTGATSSYARKYALNGLLAIDDTKDADAQAPAQQTSLPKCEQCGSDIIATFSKKGQLLSPNFLADYSWKKFGRCLCSDCMKHAEQQDESAG
jgi:hypothetical protein